MSALLSPVRPAHCSRTTRAYRRRRRERTALYRLVQERRGRHTSIRIRSVPVLGPDRGIARPGLPPRSDPELINRSSRPPCSQGARAPPLRHGTGRSEIRAPRSARLRWRPPAPLLYAIPVSAPLARATAHSCSPPRAPHRGTRARALALMEMGLWISLTLSTAAQSLDRLPPRDQRAGGNS
jgi:hypothetical protein